MTSADPALMRAINQFQVMDAIRRHGPISRVEIVDKTELSPTTVSAITSSLLGDNVIIPAKNEVAKAPIDGPIVPREYGVATDNQSPANMSRGRPRKMLSLNPSAACVVGVKLTPDQITVAVTDFRADVLNTNSMPIKIKKQSVEMVSELIEKAILKCIKQADIELTAIRGISIGLPGVIERNNGICRQSTIFEQSEVLLVKELEKRLPVQISLDTDANLITLAESWFGQAKGMDDYMVVSVEQNLGLGIMHQGELFRGANGLCPDLSDLLISIDDEVGGRRLSEVASVSAMLEAIGIWKNTDSDPTLTEGMNRLVELADDGNKKAIEIMSYAGRGLGAAITSLITLFAPSRVIVTGVGVTAGNYLLTPMRETVQKSIPSSMSEVTEITMHSWSDDTWARGAAAMTLRSLYGMPWEAMAPIMRI
ncbi:MAG: ROK family transcriptional regulator [Alphaproteobacteria bacterium]|nr:ROK family transcriptional regulator [Alphaproteobacteria bacterium]